MTSGIVSGKGRDIQVDNGTRITNLIQTDAAINPGNSGGPLADATGAVVGINTAVATDSSGIGFAIPIDIARPIMAQAVKGEALSRPWIGIRFESIDLQLKKDKGLPVDAGALVSTTGYGHGRHPGQPRRQGRHQGRRHHRRRSTGSRSTRSTRSTPCWSSSRRATRSSWTCCATGPSLKLSVTLGTRPSDL